MNSRRSGVTFSSQMDETEFQLPIPKVDNVESRREIVETELVREELYRKLLRHVKTWLLYHNQQLPWTEMQISHLLLRYIFNKKATIDSSRSDPVFISGRSAMARQQLQRDLDSIQIANFEDLAQKIDEEVAEAARELCFRKIEIDEPVVLSSTDEGQLIYKGRIQQDFAGLAKRYGPKYYNAAYALGLRYSYIRLTGHGLARDYGKDTERKPDDPLACECFASAFNHYFDKYHSAFPDLETYFGSRGSFFKIKWEQEPKDMTYYVCPPFDDALIQLTVNHVLDALRRRLLSRVQFVFTIPGSWTRFNAFEELKKSFWAVKITNYPKGKLPFIDYMASTEKDQIIYPTDICEIVLSNIQR